MSFIITIISADQRESQVLPKKSIGFKKQINIQLSLRRNQNQKFIDIFIFSVSTHKSAFEVKKTLQGLQGKKKLYCFKFYRLSLTDY